MTKRELAEAIIKLTPMKDWRDCLKEAEIKKMMRQSKAELERFYKIKKEQ